jgi:esterase/lipase superfamily enzyme
MARAALWHLPALLVVLSLGLSACAGRPGPEVLATVAAGPSPSRTVTVYAATTRERVRPGTNEFGSTRAGKTNFSSFDISLPENHKTGAIEWPKGKPDAAKSFAVTRQAILGPGDFQHAISGASADKATVFVHGYNYNYQESLFRLAQMASDAEGERIPILFSWPSVASVRGYVADKDAATFSRDNLAALLTTLSKDRHKGGVIVFSHSMDPQVQEAARENGVVVVDISSLKAPNALNHDRYIDLAALVPRLDTRTGGPPAFVDAGTFMFNGIGSGTKPAVSAVNTVPDRALD